MSYSHTSSLSLLCHFTHGTHFLLIYLLFLFTYTRAFIFSFICTQTLSKCTLALFLHHAHLHFYFESSFASFPIFYEAFFIGRHDSCEWDQKPHKKHFLDLGLHFSFISQIQFAIHILGRKYRKIRVKSRN